MKPSRKQITTPKRAPPTPKFKTPLSKAKDPVEVFCRIRPATAAVEVLCIRKVNNVTIQLVNPEDVIKNTGKEFKGTNYTFSYVFDSDSTQKEVFSKIALPLIDDFLHCKNGLLFAYGVTSSGKTFTITGAHDNCGILPRTLDVIFNSIGALQPRKYTFKSDKANGFSIQQPEDAMMDMQKELQSTPQRTPRTRRREAIGQEWSQRDPIKTKLTSVDQSYRYSVFITFIEIYNNYVYDLLEEENPDDVVKRKASSKQVREDSKHNMYVAGITEIEARNADEAFALFQRGRQRRKVSNTTLNSVSSRSHSVFTIKLVRAPVDGSGHEILMDESLLNITQLSLVDLAGSERSVRTGNTGSQLKEAGSINNSLMVLRQCLEALREKQQTGVNKFIPYRMSKLTHLFRSYFEEEGKVRVVVCAHPGDSEYDELVHVMKFAEMAQDVLLTRQVEAAPVRKKPTRLFSSLADGDFPLAPKIILPEGLMSIDDDETLPKLANNLRDILTAWRKNTHTLNEKMNGLRTTFEEVHNQNSTYAQQVRTQEMDLKGRDHQLHVLEHKMSIDEVETQRMVQQMQEKDQIIQRLEQKTHEKEFLAEKYKNEKERIKDVMQERIETQSATQKRIMDSILAQKKKEIEAKVCVNEEKFQMLRDILNTEDPTEPNRYVRFGMRASLSDTNLCGEQNPQYRENRAPPTSNPRRARSQSGDAGTWIDHRPPHCVDTGTIFTPHMKKKKSVSTLNAKDICKEKGSGYVLTHQEQDQATGDVQTQLVKGNIIPSSGGGVQVIFNDVETVRQISPNRKRASEYELRDRVGDSRPPVHSKKSRP